MSAIRIFTDMPQPRSIKYQDAVSMYETGLSVQDCADFYNITRQAMHKILIRRGCTFRPNLKFKTDNHFFRGGSGNFGKKKRAQHMVEKAIKKGILIPSPCETCGSEQNIHAHHDDYDKPLVVRWMCQRCHHEWHKQNVAINA